MPAIGATGWNLHRKAGSDPLFHESPLRSAWTAALNPLETLSGFLLEVELKKYKPTVGKRYQDYWSSGRSLDFGWEDIESESKEIALGRNRKDGEENIAEREKDEGLSEKEGARI